MVSVIRRRSYHFVSGIQTVYVQYVSPPIFSATDVIAVFGLENGIVAEPPAGHLCHQEDDHVRGRQSKGKKKGPIKIEFLYNAQVTFKPQRFNNYCV